MVDVCDEYTYYTSEAPHLAGAKVAIMNSATDALVMQGTTDENGLYIVESLPEGYYKLMVSADKHDVYTNNILVDPGKENRKTINLSFQAITIDWQVEETTVNDEYEIVTTVKYETNVPVPVVEVEPAGMYLQQPRKLWKKENLVNKNLFVEKKCKNLLIKGYICSMRYLLIKV